MAIGRTKLAQSGRTNFSDTCSRKVLWYSYENLNPYLYSSVRLVRVSLLAALGILPSLVHRSENLAN